MTYPTTTREELQLVSAGIGKYCLDCQKFRFGLKQDYCGKCRVRHGFRMYRLNVKLAEIRRQQAVTQ